MVRPGSGLCIVYKNEDCGIFATNIAEKYVSAQYYDVIPEEEVSADGVDGKLKCIMLKWDRYGEAKHERARCLLYVL